MVFRNFAKRKQSSDMRHAATVLCLLMAILASCQSEHERQVHMMKDLREATDKYDMIPDDSLARAVLYYMERHGSPNEQQQAWRMMAKMYRRHGSLFSEDFAYQMAMDCVDSTNTDFDPLAVEEILGEWSMNQYYSLNDSKAQHLAHKAKEMAETAGDSVAFYKYMGLEAYVYILSLIHI